MSIKTNNQTLKPNKLAFKQRFYQYNGNKEPAARQYTDDNISCYPDTPSQYPNIVR